MYTAIVTARMYTTTHCLWWCPTVWLHYAPNTTPDNYCRTTTLHHDPVVQYMCVHVHKRYTVLCTCTCIYTVSVSSQDSQHLGVGDLGVVADEGRRQTVVCHAAGNEVAEDVCGVWRVQTQLLQLSQEQVKTYSSNRSSFDRQGVTCTYTQLPALRTTVHVHVLCFFLHCFQSVRCV